MIHTKAMMLMKLGDGRPTADHAEPAAGQKGYLPVAMFFSKTHTSPNLPARLAVSLIYKSVLRVQLYTDVVTHLERLTH